MIAIVGQERFLELNSKLEQNPQLALASYKFKHPPISERAYSGGVSEIIDNAITEGVERDEVLLLLGSPDHAYFNGSKFEQNTYGWYETWGYNTGPVSGYVVHFSKDGHVVQSFKAVDSPGVP